MRLANGQPCTELACETCSLSSRLRFGVLGGYFTCYEKNHAGDDDHTDDELDDTHITTSLIGKWLTACRLRHRRKYITQYSVLTSAEAVNLMSSDSRAESVINVDDGNARRATVEH